MLVSGLTLAHDTLVCAAFSNLGYKVEHHAARQQALQFGKELETERSNPTYFTVGNLVKHLVHLRDKHGMATKDIVENYLFITAEHAAHVGSAPTSRSTARRFAMRASTASASCSSSSKAD